MDSLALPKTVTFSSKEDGGGDIEDVDAIVKKLIRGQQRKKNKATAVAAPSATSVAASAAAKDETAPELRKLARESVEHVQRVVYKDLDKKQTFRCHGCARVCRDIRPLLYPVSMEPGWKGRGLFGHTECLYAYGLQRRDVPRDNGLVTLMLQLPPTTVVEPLESALVFRSLTTNTGGGEVRDSFCS